MPFFSKLGPKCQNCQIKTKFCGKFKNIFQLVSIQHAEFKGGAPFLLLSIGKGPFWADLFQNVKIVSLRPIFGR